MRKLFLMVCLFCLLPGLLFAGSLKATQRNDRLQLVAMNAKLNQLVAEYKTKSGQDGKNINDLKSQVSGLKGQVNFLINKVSGLSTQLNQKIQENQFLIAQQKRIAQASQAAVLVAKKNTQLIKTVLLQQIRQLQGRLHALSLNHLSKVVRQLSSNIVRSLPSDQSSQDRVPQTVRAVSVQPFHHTVFVPFATRIMRFTTIKPLFITVIILLLLIVVLLFIRVRSRHHNSSADEMASKIILDEEKDDQLSDQPKSYQDKRKTPSYQYLSGENVIASKLDLGKALIEMGNFDHAKQVLDSVLEEGDEKQKLEAQKLLKKMKS